MNKESFIFLDIDGPINTNENKIRQGKLGNPVSSFYIKLPRMKLYNLKMIVDATNAKIVLSSKWRLTQGLAPNVTVSPARINLDNQLAEYGLNIVSQTPFINNMRGLEIEQWLKDFKLINGYRPHYIIIDDKIHLISEYHKGHIIYCNSDFGLTKKEVKIAINLLRKQQFDEMVRNGEILI